MLMVSVTRRGHSASLDGRSSPGASSCSAKCPAEMSAQKFPAPVSRTVGTMRSFLVSLLSQFQRLTPHFVNLSLTPTGDRREGWGRGLWSPPSSNIMEPVSLGFGTERCWWLHDRVMPSRPRLLFPLRPPQHRRGPWGTHNATCHQAALGNTNRISE